MLTLIALLAVIWLVLMGFLAVLTVFFQGYVYTEPIQGITWRAPAAGSLVALSLVVWVFCDYSSQGRYSDWLKFNPRLDQPPFKELVIVSQLGKTEAYKLSPSGKEYLRSDGGRLPNKPLRVTVKENGEEVVFEPDKDAKGKIKPGPDEHVYYRDKRNRVMRDDQLGTLSTYSYGNLVGYLLLNLFHLTAWLAALWLLLDFRLGHAIGLAFVLYVVVLLLLLPPVLGYTENEARRKAALTSELWRPGEPRTHDQAQAAAGMALRAATT